jgi:hypothetical protein
MIQVLVGFNSSGMPKRFLASEYPLIRFAEIVGRENAIAGIDCCPAAASIRKTPGPSCAL